MDRLRCPRPRHPVHAVDGPEARLQPIFVDKEDVVHGIAGKAIMKGDDDFHMVHFCKSC